jgi:hypothetical protein
VNQPNKGSYSSLLVGSASSGMAFSKSMRVAAILFFCLCVVGCVTSPAYTYDLNAIVKYGFLVSKHELPNTEAFYNDTMLIPVAGVLVPVTIGSPQREGSTYAHELITTDGIELVVLSKFSGFEVGDCLKVFLSEIDEPRMTYGSECNGTE